MNTVKRLASCIILIVALAAPALAAETTPTIRETTAPSTQPYLPPVAMPDETITSATFTTSVRMLTLEPKSLDTHSSKPIHVVLYTLPNGNTNEQTFGRKEEPNQDWHYQIQHIGAQTRRVRELLPNEQFVTILLQATEKSWPTWRKNQPNSSRQIVDLVQSLHDRYGAASTIDLVSHSGGGSFIFGYLNGLDTLPGYVRRITFIDSNYAYDAAEGHAEKLWQWLNANNDHRLLVICYDDRNIVLNGKPIVSSTGGTFRSTSRMSAAFESTTTLSVGRDHDFITSTGLAGRLQLWAHTNPELKILHTILVEKNGFVYALTNGTPAEKSTAPERFYDEKLYQMWVR